MISAVEVTQTQVMLEDSSAPKTVLLLTCDINFLAHVHQSDIHVWLDTHTNHSISNQRNLHTIQAIHTVYNTNCK